MKRRLALLVMWVTVVLLLVSTQHVAWAAPDVKDTISNLMDARAQTLLPYRDVSAIATYYDQAFKAQGIVGASLLAYEQDRARDFRAWSAIKKMRIVGAKAELTFKRVEVNNNLARVQVVESLALNWIYIDKPDAVTMSGLGMKHDMDLAFVGGRWLVRRDDYKDSFRPWLNPDHSTLESSDLSLATDGSAASPASTQSSNDGAALGGPQPMTTVTYNRTQATVYADKYCGAAAGCGNNQQYNSTYAAETDDCTNFASQVLGDPAGGAGAPQDSRHNYNTNWLAPRFLPPHTI